MALPDMHTLKARPNTNKNVVVVVVVVVVGVVVVECTIIFIYMIVEHLRPLPVEISYINYLLVAS